MKKCFQQVTVIFIMVVILLVAVGGTYWYQSTYRNETHIMNVSWPSGVLEFDVVHQGLTPQWLYMIHVDSDAGCRSTSYSSVCYVESYWEKVFNITLVGSQTVHITTATPSEITSWYTPIPAPTSNQYAITLYYYIPNDKMYNYTYQFYSLTFSICGNNICNIHEDTTKTAPAIT